MKKKVKRRVKKNTKGIPVRSGSLRQRAEEVVRKKTNLSTPTPPEGTLRLLHELQVHQIELEMQNEELRRTQSELESSWQKYFDLYDLSPVGYCTVSEEGLILEANLTLAGLLGIERSKLVKQPISRYIAREDQDIFYRYMEQLAGTRTSQACELGMLRSGAGPFWARLQTVRSDDDTAVYRVVVLDVSEKRHAEATLRTSEELFRRLFAQSPTGVVMVGEDFRFKNCNEAFCRFLGYEETELIGRAFHDVTHPEDREVGAGEIRAILRNELDAAQLRKRYVRKNGEVVWGEVNIRMVRDLGGSPLHFVTVVQDITARVQAETAVAESRRNHAELFDNLDDAVTVDSVRPDGLPGNFLDVNATLCRWLGYSKTELLAMSPLQILGNRNPSFLESTGKSLAATGKALVENTFIARDGREVPIEISIRAVVYKGMNALLTVARDITERKRIYSVLRANEALLQSVTEGTTDAVFVKDAQGRYLLLNSATAGFIRKTVGEVVGKDDTAIFAPKDARKVIENDRRVMASGTTQTYEESVVADGVARTFLSTKGPVRDEKGQVCGLFGVSRDITDRKRVEERLRESEYFFKESQRAAAIGSYKTNFIDDKWESSEVLDQIFGIDRSYNRSVQGWLDIVHPDDREMMGQYLHELLTTHGKHFDREYRITRGSDNESRWVHGLGAMEYDRQGNPVLMIGTIQDITEKKESEAVLRESQQRLALAASSAQLGIWDWDIANGRMTWDDQMFRLYGIAEKPENYGVEIWQKGLHPDDAARAWDACQVALSGEKEYDPEFRVVHPDRTVRHIKANGLVLRDELGKPIRMIGINYDITERRETEERLRTSEEKWRNLFSLLPVGVSVLDSDGTVTDHNPSLATILGLTPDGLRMGVYDHRKYLRVDGTPMSQDEFPSVRAVKEQMTIGPVQIGVVKEDGNIIWTEVSAAPLTKSACVTITVDVTARKQAEEREKELREKLERAARMESLGVLAGGVAHDLNNVLGPIVVLPDLVAEYVERRGDPTDPYHPDTIEALQAMKTSAQRAAAVVSDLVVMGRRGQFQQTQVNLDRVVDQMLGSKQVQSIQARRRDVQITRKASAGPVWCMGSESRLARVLANMVGNAAEAIDGQGDVVVATGRKLFSAPYQGYEVIPAGDYVTVEVADTGCGMDAKTMARIFEPFFSTKAPNERSGSGLGLSVVHGLVRDHSGFIDVKSEPGKGTTVTVYLPAVTEGVSPEESGRSPLPDGHGRVLVVDDEPGQQVTSRHQLRKLGYDATVVTCGDEALAFFEAAKREGKPAPFDLVIVDMIMKGLNGMATCKAIMALYPAQKLLIVSGHAPGDLEKEAKGLGIEWLAKPYTARELGSAVRTKMENNPIATPCPVST